MAVGALLSLRLPHRSPESTHPSREEPLSTLSRNEWTNPHCIFLLRFAFAEEAACPRAMQAGDQPKSRTLCVALIFHFLQDAAPNITKSNDL